MVEKDRIRCQYHGWAYDRSGRLVDVPHETFGKDTPQCRLRAYPVRERYGLLWIFFGDAERAHEVPMPEIPELEGEHRWACLRIGYEMKAHHSMIIDNVCDFTHAYLHRKYKPFTDPKLTSVESNEKNVFLTYDTKVGRGRITSLFVDRSRIGAEGDSEHMKLGYEYPYQWSNTGDEIKHWMFVLPIDRMTTRVFFLFYFKNFKVPLVPAHIPRGLMQPIIEIAKELYVSKVLVQDKVAVEAEQEGWERYWNTPIAEVSPVVNAFQAYTVDRWEKHLQSHKKGRHLRMSDGVVAHESTTTGQDAGVA